MQSILELDGLRFAVETMPDTDHGAPWDEEDGHGPVRDPGARLRCVYSGRTVKRPGERPMDNGRGDVWLYDWQAAIRKARDEAWGLAPEDRAKLAAKLGREPTAGEVRAESVRRDFEYLRAWLRDDWSYVGVVVTLLDVDGEPTNMRGSLWGIDNSDDEYLDDVALELAAEVSHDVGDARTLAGPQVRQ